MSRPWFEEGVYRDNLQAKIDQDGFFVLLPYETPAKVLKLIYAGYKVQYPTGKEEVINLTNTTVQDITAEEYQVLVGPYLAREEALKQQQEAATQQALLEKQRIQALQQSCLHEEIYVAESVRAAGYSSEDYHCKVNKRSLPNPT